MLNCGSSSIKYALYDMADQSVITSGGIEKIGLPDSFITVSIIYAALFERDCIEREFGRLDAWWNSLRKKNSNTSNETEPR